jgi:site-specific DNA-cytosine methylase
MTVLQLQTPEWALPLMNPSRYKALGNSWAVPVVRWIGKRIQLAIEVAA